MVIAPIMSQTAAWWQGKLAEPSSHASPKAVQPRLALLAAALWLEAAERLEPQPRGFGDKESFEDQGKPVAPFVGVGPTLAIHVELANVTT